MKTIAHISDLHFGRIDLETVPVLLSDLSALAPSLIVISGDIVQRAGHRHFAAARSFLRQLDRPFLIIPGNHDIPVFDWIARFTAPFRRYSHYITQDLSPVYLDDEMAVLGLNSARAFILDFSQGRINHAQVQRVSEVFGHVPHHVFKVLVTHHPFLPPPDAPATQLIGRAKMAVSGIANSGVDLMLAGHLHRSYVGDIAHYHTHVERSVLVAQASTTTSTRLRDEPNSYSLIHIDPPEISFDVRAWTGQRFEPAGTATYRRNGHRWDRLGEGAQAAQSPAS